MRSRCAQDALKMRSRCAQDALKMRSRCAQDALKMRSLILLISCDDLVLILEPILPTPFKSLFLARISRLKRKVLKEKATLLVYSC
jgi:hypothetical protein